MHMKRIAMASVAAMATVATASQAARTGIAYAGSDGIVADAIAKALAVAGDESMFDIMFLPCGGSGMPITVQADSSELPESEITLPECTYKRPGFSFAGWREGGEWYAHEDTEELLQPGDRTAARPYFHAVWVPDGSQISDGETYQVRFLGAAGSSLDEDTTVSYLVDEPVLLPSIEQHVHRDDEPAIMRGSCIGWRDTATGEMYSNSQIQMNIGTGERVIELEAVYGSPWEYEMHYVFDYRGEDAKPVVESMQGNAVDPYITYRFDKDGDGIISGMSMASEELTAFPILQDGKRGFAGWKPADALGTDEIYTNETSAILRCVPQWSDDAVNVRFTVGGEEIRTVKLAKGMPLSSLIHPALLEHRGLTAHLGGMEGGVLEKDMDIECESSPLRVVPVMGGALDDDVPYGAWNAAGTGSWNEAAGSFDMQAGYGDTIEIPDAVLDDYSDGAFGKWYRGFLGWEYDGKPVEAGEKIEIRDSPYVMARWEETYRDEELALKTLLGNDAGTVARGDVIECDLQATSIALEDSFPLTGYITMDIGNVSSMDELHDSTAEDPCYVSIGGRIARVDNLYRRSDGNGGWNIEVYATALEASYPSSGETASWLKNDVPGIEAMIRQAFPDMDSDKTDLLAERLAEEMKGSEIEPDKAYVKLWKTRIQPSGRTIAEMTIGEMGSDRTEEYEFALLINGDWLSNRMLHIDPVGEVFDVSYADEATEESWTEKLTEGQRRRLLEALKELSGLDLVREKDGTSIWELEPQAEDRKYTDALAELLANFFHYDSPGIDIRSVSSTQTGRNTVTLGNARYGFDISLTAVEDENGSWSVVDEDGTRLKAGGGKVNPTPTIMPWGSTPITPLPDGGGDLPPINPDNGGGNGGNNDGTAPGGGGNNDGNDGNGNAPDGGNGQAHPDGTQPDASGSPMIPAVDTSASPAANTRTGTAAAGSGTQQAAGSGTQQAVQTQQQQANQTTKAAEDGAPMSKTGADDMISAIAMPVMASIGIAVSRRRRNLQ